MEYEIVKILTLPSGHLHVEAEFTAPDGVVEHVETNFGPDMVPRDAWKSHLDEIMKNHMAPKVTGAFVHHLGKRSIKD